MIIDPQMAKSGTGIDIKSLGSDYSFDTKHDGIRAICYWDGETVRFSNRVKTDITYRYPDLQKDLGNIPMVLDGEIVAHSGAFQDIATRDAQHSAIDDIIKSIPVSYMAFDILFRHGADLRGNSYSVRRQILTDSSENFPLDYRLSRSSTDPAFYYEVIAGGGEGVIAKRKSSPYSEGKRNKDWIKFKAVHSVTAIATGYERGKGRREEIGALNVAMIDKGAVVSIGRVGTGFTDRELASLKKLLDRDGMILVELEAYNRTRDNKLRHPVYKGLRTDQGFGVASIKQLDSIPKT